MDLKTWIILLTRMGLDETAQFGLMELVAVPLKMSIWLELAYPQTLPGFTLGDP